MRSKKIDFNILVIYVVLICGVIIGCCLYIFASSSDNSFIYYIGLDQYNISIKMTERVFFSHLLQRRVSQIIIFILFTVLTTYYIATLVFAVGFGIYYGFTVCDLLIKYGSLGFGYGFFCFFPHYIFVFYILFLLCKWKANNTNRLIKHDKSMNRMEYFIKIFVIIGLLLFSFFWEFKFQKFFLTYFIQYLV